jgi:hypothetical protein
VLSRISLDSTRKSAFFTIDEDPHTFLFCASTLEYEAVLALSREGDCVSIRLDDLPHAEYVVRVVEFINHDFFLMQVEE